MRDAVRRGAKEKTEEVRQRAWETSRFTIVFQWFWVLFARTAARREGPSFFHVVLVLDFLVTFKFVFGVTAHGARRLAHFHARSNPRHAHTAWHACAYATTGAQSTTRTALASFLFCRNGPAGNL